GDRRPHPGLLLRGRAGVGRYPAGRAAGGAQEQGAPLPGQRAAGGAGGAGPAQPPVRGGGGAGRAARAGGGRAGRAGRGPAGGRAGSVAVWTTEGPVLSHVSPPPGGLAIGYAVGSVVSRHGSAHGKVFLAYQGAEAAEEVIFGSLRPLTRATVTNPAELLSQC